MKYLWRYKASNSIYGEQLIRMAKLSMYSYKPGGTVRLQSVSSRGWSKNHRAEPRKIVTDKLKSYGVAHRELIPDTIHDTTRYSNNCAEVSHQPTRVRERGMRRFKSTQQAQRFLSIHAMVYNLFNLGRHLISAKHYRLLRQRTFVSWKEAAAI